MSDFSKIEFYIENSNVFIAIIIVIIALLTSKIIKKLIYKSIKIVQVKSPSKSEILLRSYFNVITNIINFFIFLITLVIILLLFNINIGLMLASAGFIGIMITYVFQDLIKDVTTGFFIVFKSTFKVGDYIIIDDLKGRVEEIQSRYVVIIDDDNNKIIINNRIIDHVIVKRGV